MNATYFKSKKTISILGCGWLGLPLSQFFMNQNIKVKGSSPTPGKLANLKDCGILSYHIHLNPEINKDHDPDFFDADILIVNFPPKRRADIVDWHIKQISSLIDSINNSKVKKVIFISSTSVYAETNNIVTEENTEEPKKTSGKALKTAEKLLILEKDFDTTVIRFGGLIGYDRRPGRFLGSKHATNGEVPVNLIHRDDCIGIINHVIKNNIWNEILNACCPYHPTKKKFYQAAARSEGFPMPEFTSSKSCYKIVNCDKLIHRFKYQFRYLNPIDTLI